MSRFSRFGSPGAALAFGAVTAYSIHNVGMRILLNDVSIWGVLFVRGLLGIVIVAMAARIFKLNVLGKNKPLLTIIGLCGLLATTCIISAISLIPLYQALVLMYLYPALSVPLNYMVNKTKLRKGETLWVCIAFGGCLLLIWPDEAIGLTLGIGQLIGLCSAVFYSLTFVLTASLGDDNCGLEPLCYYSLWAAGGVGLYLLLSDHNPGLDGLEPVLSSLGIGVVGLAGLLMGYATLRWMEPYKAGIIGMLEVFFGAICSWLMFHDPMSPRALVGGLVILFVALRLRRA